MDPKIISECYNAIDINLLKGDSIISKKMLLVYASFEYDAKKSVEIIKSLILNGDPFEQAVAAKEGKESEVLKKALFQLGKFPHGDRTEELAALNAIIGNKDNPNRYKDAAESNDPIKREAVLQLAKIPQINSTDRIAALDTIIGNQGNPNRYEVAAGSMDPIKREALLQLGKIPQINNTDRLAALDAIIGNKGNPNRYKVAAGSNDPIKREALLQLAKIPNGDGTDQIAALDAIIGNQGNPNRYKDAIKTNDPIKREALLQLAKIPHGDGTNQLAALYALCDYIARDNYRLNVERNADDESHVMYYYNVLRNGGDFGEDIISTLINAVKGIKDEVRKNKLRGRLNIAFIIYSEQRYKELSEAKANFRLIHKYENIIVRHSGFLSPKLKVTLSSLKEVIPSTRR